MPALSGRERIIIDGDEFEDNFTSGGAADLPDAYSGRVRDLDYKTLRYPGHYQWVKIRYLLWVIAKTESKTWKRSC